MNPTQKYGVKDRPRQRIKNNQLKTQNLFALGRHLYGHFSSFFLLQEWVFWRVFKLGLDWFRSDSPAQLQPHATRIRTPIRTAASVKRSPLRADGRSLNGRDGPEVVGWNIKKWGVFVFQHQEDNRQLYFFPKLGTNHKVSLKVVARGEDDQQDTHIYYCWWKKSPTTTCDGAKAQ